MKACLNMSLCCFGNSFWSKKCLTEEGERPNVFKNLARYLKRTPEKVYTLFKNAGDILLFYSALPHSIKGSKVKVAKLAEL